MPSSDNKKSICFHRAIRDAFNQALWNQFSPENKNRQSDIFEIKMFRLESDYMKGIQNELATLAIQELSKDTKIPDIINQLLQCLREHSCNYEAERLFLDQMIIAGQEWYSYNFTEIEITNDVVWDFSLNNMYKMIGYLRRVGVFPAHKILIKLNSSGFAEFSNGIFATLNIAIPKFIDDPKKIKLPPLVKNMSMKKNDRKPCLILDIDETLIHSDLTEAKDKTYDFKISVVFDGRESVVCVNLRPFLKEFLDFCINEFEVVIYTASVKQYADAILEKIDPNNRIKHRFYRSDCTFTGRYFVKDLRYLGRNLNQVAILDNSPLAFAFQLENSIPCHPYYRGKNDYELLELIPFLKLLKTKSNWPKFLESIFHLKQFTKELANSTAISCNNTTDKQTKRSVSTGTINN